MRGTPKPNQQFQLWLDDVVTQFGSDVAVGRFCGYKDGANVGRWRSGYNNPSILACLRLARARGEDPLDILKLAGHIEEAKLLEGHVAYLDPLPLWVPQLEAVVHLLDNATQMMRSRARRTKKGASHESADEEHEAEARKDRSLCQAPWQTDIQDVPARHLGGHH